jgi:hypothetical protein
MIQITDALNHSSHFENLPAVSFTSIKVFVSKDIFGFGGVEVEKFGSELVIGFYKEKIKYNQ